MNAPTELVLNDLAACAKDLSGWHCWGQINNPIELLNSENILDAEQVGLLLVDSGNLFFSVCGLAQNKTFRCRGTDWPQRKPIENLVSNAPAVLDNFNFIKVRDGIACVASQTYLRCWGMNLDSNNIDLSNAKLGTLLDIKIETVAINYWNDVEVCGLFEKGIRCWGRSWKYGASNNLTLAPLQLLVNNPKHFSGGQKNLCAIDDHGLHCVGALNSGRPLNVNPTSFKLTPYYFQDRAACTLERSGKLACWGGYDEMYSFLDLLPPMKDYFLGQSAEICLVAMDGSVSCRSGIYDENLAGQSYTLPDFRDPVRLTFNWGADKHVVLNWDSTGSVIHRYIFNDEEILDFGLPGFSQDSKFCIALSASGLRCFDKATGAETSYPNALSMKPKKIELNGSYVCGLDNNSMECLTSSTSKEWRPLGKFPLKNPTELCFGRAHVCALDEAGAHCWGWDIDGSTKPPVMNKPRNLQCLENSACAWTDDGEQCWGSRTSGINGFMHSPVVFDY